MSDSIGERDFRGGISEGTHTDVCISEGGGVTLNDAYIRQGRKMMPLET